MGCLPEFYKKGAGVVLPSAQQIWYLPHRQKPNVAGRLIGETGPVIRITPSMLLVNDSTKLPEIYHRSADKSDHYVTGGFGNAESVLNMKEHKTHAKFRKLIAGPYSFTNVKKLEYLIDARTQNWIDRLAAFARTEEKFDFAPWTV